MVAVEVRRLAQSAASAPSDVKKLIEQLATEVFSGTKLVAEATGKLNTMFDGIRENDVLIQGISQASQEQSSAIDQVSTAIRQMDEMTQHNAALVEETNAAVEQTEAQANELDTIVEISIAGAPQRTRHVVPKKRSSPQGSAARVYSTEGSSAPRAD